MVMGKKREKQPLKKGFWEVIIRQSICILDRPFRRLALLD